MNHGSLPDLPEHSERTCLFASGDLTAASTRLELRVFLVDGCTNVRGEDAVRKVPQ